MDGFVLGGGASRRMGIDKARMPFPRRFPMAAHVAGALRAAGLRPFIVRGADDGLPFVAPDGEPVPIVVDGPLERHPLRGVAAAMRHTAGDRLVIVPCDLPWLDVASIRRLIDAAGSGEVVATDGDRVQPLVAILRVARVADVDAIIDRDGPARDLVVGVPRVALPAAALRNVNTAEQAGEDPVTALVAGLSWLDDEALRRVAAGEIERQRARGAIGRHPIA